MSDSMAVHGNWRVRLLPNSRIVEPTVVERLGAIVAQWVALHPAEGTLAQGRFGVASLIVRIDYSLQPDGSIATYEVEIRPSGIGLTAAFISPNEFAPRLAAIRREWPPFVSVVADDRNTCDDELWAPCVKLGEALAGSQLVLVRSEPHQEQFHELAPRAIAPIVTKGAKSPGKQMGLWRTISVEDDNIELDSPLWEESFVLKPRQGSKCRDLEFWLSAPGQSLRERKRNFPGLSSQNQIRYTMSRYHAMYLQPLLVAPRDEEGRFILDRMYFGWSPGEGRYLPLGGMSIHRANLRIHGASDAAIGALVF